MELESRIWDMQEAMKELNVYLEEALYEVYINSKNNTVPNNPKLKELYEELFVNSVVSSVLSKDENRYYLVVLGASQEMENEILTITTPTNTIGGYYFDSNPSNKYIRALGVKNELTILLFDTEKEILRTNNIEELNEFITENK